MTYIPEQTEWTIPKNRIRATPTSSRRGEIDLSACPSIFQVTNRAEKGGMKGKPVFLAWSGRMYPEGADPKKPETLLAPGDHISVPSSVIFGIFGRFDKPQTKEQKWVIANRLGGYKYPPVSTKKGERVWRNEININPIGPPERFPDLIIEVVDARGNTVGDTVSLYDKFVEGDIFE